MTTITIIGSGGMATAIGERAAKAGYTVEFMGRNSAKAEALANKFSEAGITGVYGAKPQGDIVILAVLHASTSQVMSDYGVALEGKTIVDITNPFAPDALGLVIAPDTSVSQQIANVAPKGAHVVKAFNTIFGHMLSRGEMLDAFIAGDDAGSKACVSEFITNIGLRPLDVGALRMAKSLEELALVLMGIARTGLQRFDIALQVAHS